MRRFLNRLMPPGGPCRSLAGVLPAASLALAGCLIQPSYSVNRTTADGVNIEVPLTRDKVVITDGVLSIDRFDLPVMAIDGGGKGVAFGLEIHFREGAKPVSVVVDDVSDLPIMSVFVDNAPVLTKKNDWHALTPVHGSSEAIVKWLMTLDNSVQVYRFTVKLADGTTHVLRYPIFAPGQMKLIMRTQMSVS